MIEEKKATAKERKNMKAILFCCIVMMITAGSDALRGVFLPQFKSTFSLSESQAGRIIMISYIGNLIFLSVGGTLSDRIPRKRFIGGLLCLWTAALAMYILTENYILLLICMIFSMGGSTMLSTSVNVITPLMFASPAMYISIFNFLQGIGITLSQNIGGRFSDSLNGWHGANAVIAVLAVISLILLSTLDLPDPAPRSETTEKADHLSILKTPQSLLLILIFGGYFISEHGLQNWLTSYGSEHLGLSVSKAAMYLSMFYGCMTVGRLLLAPFIERIGIFRCLIITAAVGAVLYTAGIVLGKNGLILLGVSGAAYSVLYPLLVMLTGSFFDPSCAGTATGLILSIATLFDIGFNACFGSLAEKVGYGSAIYVLPVSSAAMAVLLVVLKKGVKKSAEIR